MLPQSRLLPVPSPVQVHSSKQYRSPLLSGSTNHPGGGVQEDAHQRLHTPPMILPKGQSQTGLSHVSTPLLSSRLRGAGCGFDDGSSDSRTPEYASCTSPSVSSSPVPCSSSATAPRPGAVSTRGSTWQRTGADRFEFIEDSAMRKKSQSKQIKQIKIDIMRLRLTTGAHSAVIVVPESWKVHKFATAGNFNSFLQMYACALESQRMRHRRQVALNMDEVWERFQGQGGLHQIEALCAALLKEGCDEDAVEDAKDTYLAGLASHEASGRVGSALARHLTAALRSFSEEPNGPVGGVSSNRGSDDRSEGAADMEDKSD